MSCGPALEALTKTADTANLEAVRRIKTQHARLVTRVTAAKEALEGLMGGWPFVAHHMGVTGPRECRERMLVWGQVRRAGEALLGRMVGAWLVSYQPFAKL